MECRVTAVAKASFLGTGQDIRKLIDANVRYLDETWANQTHTHTEVAGTLGIV
jgi:hypothetical protein